MPLFSRIYPGWVRRIILLYLPEFDPIYAFFISSTFMHIARLKMGKNKQKLSNILTLNFSQTYPKNKFVCINEII